MSADQIPDSALELSDLHLNKPEEVISGISHLRKPRDQFDMIIKQLNLDLRIEIDMRNDGTYEEMRNQFQLIKDDDIRRIIIRRIVTERINSLGGLNMVITESIRAATHAKKEIEKAYINRLYTSMQHNQHKPNPASSPLSIGTGTSITGTDIPIQSTTELPVPAVTLEPPAPIVPILAEEEVTTGKPAEIPTSTNEADKQQDKLAQIKSLLEEQLPPPRKSKLEELKKIGIIPQEQNTDEAISSLDEYVFSIQDEYTKINLEDSIVAFRTLTNKLVTPQTEGLRDLTENEFRLLSFLFRDSSSVFVIFMEVNYPALNKLLENTFEEVYKNILTIEVVNEKWRKGYVEYNLWKSTKDYLPTFPIAAEGIEKLEMYNLSIRNTLSFRITILESQSKYVIFELSEAIEALKRVGLIPIDSFSTPGDMSYENALKNNLLPSIVDQIIRLTTAMSIFNLKDNYSEFFLSCINFLANPQKFNDDAGGEAKTVEIASILKAFEAEGLKGLRVNGHPVVKFIEDCYGITPENFPDNSNKKTVYRAIAQKKLLPSQLEPIDKLSLRPNNKDSFDTTVTKYVEDTLALDQRQKTILFLQEHVVPLQGQPDELDGLYQISESLQTNSSPVDGVIQNIIYLRIYNVIYDMQSRGDSVENIIPSPERRLEFFRIGTGSKFTLIDKRSEKFNDVRIFLALSSSERTIYQDLQSKLKILRQKLNVTSLNPGYLDNVVDKPRYKDALFGILKSNTVEALDKVLEEYEEIMKNNDDLQKLAGHYFIEKTTDTEIKFPFEVLQRFLFPQVGGLPQLTAQIMSETGKPDVLDHYSQFISDFTPDQIAINERYRKAIDQDTQLKISIVELLTNTDLRKIYYTILGATSIQQLLDMWQDFKNFININEGANFLRNIQLIYAHQTYRLLSNALLNGEEFHMSRDVYDDIFISQKFFLIAQSSYFNSLRALQDSNKKDKLNRPVRLFSQIEQHIELDPQQEKIVDQAIADGILTEEDKPLCRGVRMWRSFDGGLKFIMKVAPAALNLDLAGETEIQQAISNLSDFLKTYREVDKNHQERYGLATIGSDTVEYRLLRKACYRRMGLIYSRHPNLKQKAPISAFNIGKVPEFIALYPNDDIIQGLPLISPSSASVLPEPNYTDNFRDLGGDELEDLRL